MYLLKAIAKAYSSAVAVRRDARAAHQVVRDILQNGELDPNLLHPFLNYSPDSLLLSTAGKASAITTWVGAVIAVVVGTVFAAFPQIPGSISAAVPALALGASVHDAFNYLHSIHNSHIDQQHLIYHVPDLGFDLALFSPLYMLAVKAFIFFGWRRHLNPMKKAVRFQLDEGRFLPDSSVRLHWKLRSGYTGIVVGEGDTLGDEFVRRHAPDEALLFATQPQKSSKVWAYLKNDAGISDLESAFATADFEHCGRLVLLPVQAQHMVFPPNDAYDISPDKLDDLLRNIRNLDKQRSATESVRRPPLPIIVVGDKKQATIIETYDSQKRATLPEQSTSINLETISRSFGEGLIVIDPTELVLQKVIGAAAGAAIVFRGTVESRRTYEEQFLQRLQEMNYRVTAPERNFRMGYNITDDPTVADPMNSVAVVLTASARDALLEKGYPRERILYVAEIVIEEIEKIGEFQGQRTQPRNSNSSF